MRGSPLIFRKVTKMNEMKIKSYGKINLSLDVTGLREDGYHTLETVMQKISLCDEVTVKWIPDDSDQIKIHLDSNKAFLPKDDRNIAYKAAKAMIEQYGEAFGGGTVDIFLRKYLPVSAGLAGGSGNGAAVLTALNRIWELKLNTRQLCSIAAPLGADVPFCVLIQNTRYGCALGSGTGTELTPIKNKFKKPIILVKPAFGVSTKEVYQGIDDCEITARPDTAAIMEALKKGQDSVVYDNMVNVLECYTLNKYDEVKRLKEKIQRETDAEMVLMTGSGPTVFAMFSNMQQAKEACYKMRGNGYEAYWARTL